MNEKSNRPAVRRVTAAWSRFWEHSEEHVTERMLHGQPQHPALLERLRAPAWAARAAAARTALSLYPAEVAALPPAERALAKGWVRRCELRALTLADDTLEASMRSGTGHLPERLLHSATVAQQQEHCSPLDDADADSSSSSSRERTVQQTAALQRLGTLPVPLAAAVHWLVARSCATAPGRACTAAALPRALQEVGQRWRVTAALTSAAAWLRIALCALLPRINYRLLSLPLGVDPVEHMQCDPLYTGGELWGRSDFSWLTRRYTHVCDRVPALNRDDAPVVRTSSFDYDTSATSGSSSEAAAADALLEEQEGLLFTTNGYVQPQHDSDSSSGVVEAGRISGSVGGWDIEVEDVSGDEFRTMFA